MNMTRVAECAGVSQSTVSRVINGRAMVNEGSRKRVLKAITDLGYVPAAPEQRPGRTARNTPRAKTGLILIVVPRSSTLHPEFTIELCRSAEEAGAEEGYATVTHFLKSPDASIPEQLLERIEGVLLLGDPSDQLIERLQRIPMVWLTSHSESEHLAVLPGNERVGELAANYLTDRKHKQLACIIAEPENASYMARMLSFRRQAESKGARIRQFVSRFARKGESELSYESLTKRLYSLVNQFLAAPVQPTGIFCPSDAETALCYRLLLSKGIQPGPKLEFVSCNNEQSFLAGLEPRPATIDIGASTRGRTAVQYLIRNLDRSHHRHGFQLLIEPTLVEPE